MNLTRLEELCKDQGEKVPLRLQSTVTTFRLDSGDLDLRSPSLECHVEVSTEKTNSGIHKERIIYKILFLNKPQLKINCD